MTLQSSLSLLDYINARLWLSYCLSVFKLHLKKECTLDRSSFQSITAGGPLNEIEMTESSQRFSRTNPHRTFSSKHRESQSPFSKFKKITEYFKMTKFYGSLSSILCLTSTNTVTRLSTATSNCQKFFQSIRNTEMFKTKTISIFKILPIQNRLRHKEDSTIDCERSE